MISFALVLLLSASAWADQMVFPMKASGTVGTYGASGYSADGYHYAEFVTLDGKPVLLKDGRVLEEGVEPGDTSKGGVSLSADGALVAYVVKTPVPGGGPAGAQVHVNGKAIGAVFERIDDLELSPNGAQLAYMARDAKGWRVVSTVGQSPVVPDQPAFSRLSNTGLVYVLPWDGQYLFYRGAEPVTVRHYDSMAASADLARFAGIYRRDDQRYVVEENGRQVGGDWANARDVQYLGGKHLAYYVSTPQNTSGGLDAVVVDGVLFPMSPTEVLGGQRRVALSPGKGVPFVVSGKPVALTIAGKKRAVMKGNKWYGESWIGFSPSGKRWLLYDDGKLRSESGVAEDSATEPESAPTFDGESTYHYLTSRGGEMSLVCGTLGDRSAASTRCARKARALGLRPEAE